MKAISIRQPWAWLIVRPDITNPEARAVLYDNGHMKDIENRDWKTNFRGPVLIHASKGMTRDEYGACFRHCEMLGVKLPPMDELQRGGIVGMATITDCVDDSESDWFFGDYGFVLADAKPLPFVPFSGALGFFDVPDDLIKDTE